MGFEMKKKTKLIHSGIDTKKFAGSLTTPIYHNSTIVFNNYKDFLLAKRKRFSKLYYGRFKTKTVITFENIVKDLYKSEKAIITSSGLSAIIITLFALVKKNDHILVVENCYEPVSNFVKDEFKKFGINCDFYSSDFNENIEKLIKTNTKLIYLESPASLNYEVQDITRFVKFARKNKIVTVMDNTWSTIIGCNPLEYGIDIVIESATKYFSGHSDCFCGLIACSNRHFNQIFKTKVRFGDFVSSESCYLAIRGLKTLSLRLKQHHESAIKMYKYLKTNKNVLSILFPSVVENKNFKLWKKYHSTGNGLITFKIKRNGKKSLDFFFDNLKFFKIGFSWGGFESLILPLESLDPFHNCNDENGFWCRIHVGLEDVNDLINDIDYAIDNYEK